MHPRALPPGPHLSREKTEANLKTTFPHAGRDVHETVQDCGEGAQADWCVCVYVRVCAHACAPRLIGVCVRVYMHAHAQADWGGCVCVSVAQGCGEGARSDWGVCVCVYVSVCVSGLTGVWGVRVCVCGVNVDFRVRTSLG